MQSSSFADLGIEIPYGRTHGQVKCVCPNCKDTRGNPKDRSLSVNLDSGAWYCHHCKWEGYLEQSIKKDMKREAPRKQYRKPTAPPVTTLHRSIVEWFNRRGISERTLEAARIGGAVEFVPQVSEKRLMIQFNYFLENELINVKSRDRDKNFKLCSGARLIPYNIDSIKGHTTCVITEGEIDALSFMEIGIESVVSVPNGANANLSYLDDFIDDYFEDKAVVYIASDTDTKGMELRAELIRRFGADRCRTISYGQYKDANEVLQHLGKEALQKCYDEAQDVPMAGAVCLRDYEQQLDNLFRNGLQKGMTIGHRNFDEICSFETRRFAVVTGKPSSGKSEFLDEICVRLNLHYGHKVAFFSPENLPLELHAAKLMEKLTGCKLEERSMPADVYAEAKEYILDNFYHILPEESYTLTNILGIARYLIRRYGIRILVLDPYNRIESERKGSQTETEYISAFIDRLTNFAAQNDLLVFLMAHPRKPDAKNPDYVPTTYDIAGSGHFFNKCDYSIIIDRRRSEGKTNVIVEKVKFRHLGMGGSVSFTYNIHNGRYTPMTGEENGQNDDANYLRANPFHTVGPVSVAEIMADYTSQTQGKVSTDTTSPASALSGVSTAIPPAVTDDGGDDFFPTQLDDKDIPF